jgi:RNase P subunit RPR2
MSYVFARITIPAEAAYLPTSHCIQCGNALLPGDRGYADTNYRHDPWPKVLCARCGRERRHLYTFAPGEDWARDQEMLTQIEEQRQPGRVIFRCHGCGRDFESIDEIRNDCPADSTRFGNHELHHAVPPPGARDDDRAL